MEREKVYWFLFYFVLMILLISLSIAYPITQNRIIILPYFTLLTIMYICAINGMYVENACRANRDMLTLASFIIYSSALILVKIFIFFQYFHGHSPFPVLWYVAFTALFLNAFYLYYLLKLNLFERFIAKLLKTKPGFGTPSQSNVLNLRAWVGLIIFSFLVSLFFQQIYPGISKKLQAPEDSIVGWSGSHIKAAVPIEGKTLKGKMASIKGKAEFVFTDKPNAIDNNIAVHVKQKDIDWGKKLRSIGSPIMERQAFVELKFVVPVFKSIRPIKITGYVRGINAIYPQSTKNGFFNKHAKVQSDKITLYLFPNKFSPESEEFMKSRHQWLQLPVFYAFIAVLILWTFVRIKEHENKNIGF